MRKGIGQTAEEIVDAFIESLQSNPRYKAAWDATPEQLQRENRSVWMLIARRILETNN